TMGEIQDRTNRIPEVEKQWADAQAEFARSQEEGKERLERLQREQIDAGVELERVEATIPDKVRPTYDYLVQAHGPDALAAVVNKVCQACRSSMTEQNWMELKAGQ